MGFIFVFILLGGCGGGTISVLVLSVILDALSSGIIAVSTLSLRLFRIFTQVLLIKSNTTYKSKEVIIRLHKMILTQPNITDLSSLGSSSFNSRIITTAVISISSVNIDIT